MTIKTLTVGELKKRLDSLPADALVVLQCDDPFYSGPVLDQTEVSEAVLYGPYEYKSITEDAYGNGLPLRTGTHPGGWYLIGDDYDASALANAQVLDRRVAFVLINGEPNV